MSLHLQKEVEHLKRKILQLSALVEESVYKAVKAIEQRDDKLAREIVEADVEIDETEVYLEEECLKILALHQPVAADLRFIIAILKINNDLERIGDLSVNIAKQALVLGTVSRPEFPAMLREMAETVRSMVKRSLDALVSLDTDLAREVCASDKEVDAMNKELYALLAGQIRERPELTDGLMCLIYVSRQLERIGDHTTNIAEDVIYMLEGEIVRHKKPK